MNKCCAIHGAYTNLQFKSFNAFLYFSVIYIPGQAFGRVGNVIGCAIIKQ